MEIVVVNAEYNTDRNKLLLSEYGRNIQKMVAYALEENDRNKRNRLAQALITLMGNMNPHLRDVADYKHKLWDHLFVMSDFKLDVDSPYPKPTRETITAKPAIVAYPQSRIRFRFYGKNIVQMIEKAAEMEEGPTKAGFINLIGSFMKNACKNFNEEMLADEEILAHLEMLSGGRIKMNHDADVQFDALQGQTPHHSNTRNNEGRNRNQHRHNRQGGGQGNNRGGQGNNNRNFRSGGGQGNNRNRNNDNRNGGDNRNNRNFRNNNNNDRNNNRGN